MQYARSSFAPHVPATAVEVQNLSFAWLAFGVDRGGGLRKVPSGRIEQLWGDSWLETRKRDIDDPLQRGLAWPGLGEDIQPLHHANQERGRFRTDARGNLASRTGPVKRAREVAFQALQLQLRLGRDSWIAAASSKRRAP